MDSKSQDGWASPFPETELFETDLHVLLGMIPAQSTLWDDFQNGSFIVKPAAMVQVSQAGVYDVGVRVTAASPSSIVTPMSTTCYIQGGSEKGQSCRLEREGILHVP